MLRNALGMCVALGLTFTAYAEERTLEMINQDIAKLDKLKGEALQKKLTGVALNSAKIQLDAGKAALEQEKLVTSNNILSSKLRMADLRMSFMELDFKTNKVETTLDDMERIYDKSLLGAYLQDKMGQLLNSQVICMAQKRCAVSDPKKIDAEKIRQELFPESQAIRGDYYEKVNKKSATPVQ